MKKTSLLVVSFITVGGLVPTISASAANSVSSDGLSATNDGTVMFKEDTTGGTKGPLRIDSISDISFGDFQEVSGNAKEYNAVFNPVGAGFEAPSIIVTDNRGTNEGWSLSVKSDQFKTTDATAIEKGAGELTGAKISFYSVSPVSKGGVTQTAAPEFKSTATDTPAVVDGLGNSTPIVTALVDHGMGTWENSFGNPSEAVDAAGSSVAASATSFNNQIKLSVPGGLKIQKDVEYKSVLTWTLAVAPN